MILPRERNQRTVIFVVRPKSALTHRLLRSGSVVELREGDKINGLNTAGRTTLETHHVKTDNNECVGGLRLEININVQRA